MATLLHIDASARSGRSDIDKYGSHTRRLSARFIAAWQHARPEDSVIYRDVGTTPPAPVTADWIHAAFTNPETREPWMVEALRQSDLLVDEVIEADMIVAGVPMYNFGVPAQFKAYIDNIVRVGRTFGFERHGEDVAYWPMLSENKRLVLLSARGDVGYGIGGALEAQNHVEPSIKTAFAYIGVRDVCEAAVEYDEYGGAKLEAALEMAEREVDVLVMHLLAKMP